MKKITNIMLLTISLVILSSSSLLALDEYKVDKSKIPAPLKTDKKIDFVKEIKPIFEKACINCHADNMRRPKGKYSMSTREKTIKGGRSELKAIILKKSDKSPLVYMISDAITAYGDDDAGEDYWMPLVSKREKYKKLTQKQVSLIRTWIDQGAVWPKDVKILKKD